MLRKAYIDPGRCDRSPFCPAKRICPIAAIKQGASGISEVDESVCTGCGKCSQFCPAGAITIRG